MPVKIRIISCALWLILLSFSGYTQNGIFLSQATFLSVLPGTVFSVDSLVLVPSANFIITGVNSGTRNATLIHPLSTANISRVFHYASTLNGFSGTITMYYRDAELNSIPEETLTLNIHNGSMWHAYADNVNRDGAQNYVTTTGFTNVDLNELTLANPVKILPVYLLSFTAQIINKAVRLNWITSSEIKNAFFEIERSGDGYAFKPLGRINGNGTSTLTHYYDFTDFEPISGNNFYRLKQVDVDNQFEYSKVIKIAFNEMGIACKVYPNPVTNTLIINSSDEVIRKKPLARLFDSQDRLLEVFPISDVSQKLNTSLLPSGHYVIIIDLENDVQKLQFIKK